MLLVERYEISLQAFHQIRIVDIVLPEFLSPVKTCLEDRFRAAISGRCRSLKAYRDVMSTAY